MRTLLQRKCSCGGSCGSCGGDTAPPSVQRVLSTSGQPLEAETRARMESRFGHDFSQVRLHTDSAAAQSARDVAARAYTVGNHIAFGAGAAGSQLLAHELTHTIQQQRGGASMARSPVIGSEHSPAEAEADRVAARVAAGQHAGPVRVTGNELARAPEDEETSSTSLQDDVAQGGGVPVPPIAGKVVKGSPRQECGRKTNTRVPGFDDTTAGPHISAIDVEILTNAHSPVKLTWANVPAGVTVPATLNGSPGAGLCQMRKGKGGMKDVDCSDPEWSKTTDSLCTPLGTFTVQGFRCHLAGEPKASRATWFHHVRGIAFHNYDPVPPYPASHGCVRIDEGKADWIYDNSIPSVTRVAVRRAAGDPGPKCYKPGIKKPVDRAGYVAPQAPGSTGQQPGSDAAPDGPKQVDGS